MPRRDEIEIESERDRPAEEADRPDRRRTLHDSSQSSFAPAEASHSQHLLSPSGPNTIHREKTTNMSNPSVSFPNEPEVVDIEEATPATGHDGIERQASLDKVKQQKSMSQSMKAWDIDVSLSIESSGYGSRHSITRLARFILVRAHSTSPPPPRRAMASWTKPSWPFARWTAATRGH